MDVCITKECIKEYLDRLSVNIAEYMSMPSNMRTAEAVSGMVDCWMRVDAMYNKFMNEDSHMELSRSDADEWNKKMLNADGTEGGHWTIAETSNFERPYDMPDWMWNLTMNMMYSDYCNIGNDYGIGTANFYAAMARAFLYDKDSVEPSAKLCAYYHHIVK